MPHVNIKHFPAPLTGAQEAELIGALTTAITTAFGCPERVVSIALEPVDPQEWTEQVFFPEIVDRRELVRKLPDY